MVFIADVLRENSPDFVLRGADFSSFLASEMTKVLPIVVDFSNYFGYNLNILNINLPTYYEYSFV